MKGALWRPFLAANPAVKLVGMARRYLGEITSGSRELQADLGRLAETVAA